MRFEEMIRVIAQRVSFGQTLAEIHDAIVANGVSEADFYFAWHAAKIWIAS